MEVELFISREDLSLLVAVLAAFSIRDAEPRISIPPPVRDSALAPQH